MTLDKNTLSTMKINAMEEIIDMCIRDKRYLEKNIIEILIYLKTSGRYKENHRYERSSFYQYIEDRFNIRKNTYMEMQIAFCKFPVETIEYGVGLVCKVRRLCGPVKSANVFKLIKDTETYLNKEIKREWIEKIIQKHAIVPKKESADKVDWKALYEAECARHEKTKLMLKEANRLIIEKNEQIKKLKNTIKKLQDKNGNE